MKQKSLQKSIAFVLVCVMVLSMGMFVPVFAAAKTVTGAAAGDTYTFSNVISSEKKSVTFDMEGVKETKEITVNYLAADSTYTHVLKGGVVGGGSVYTKTGENEYSFSGPDLDDKAVKDAPVKDLIEADMLWECGGSYFALEQKKDEGDKTDGATPAAVTTPAGTTTSGAATTPGATTTTPEATTTPEGFVFDAAKGVSQFADAKDNPMASFIDVLIKKDIIRGYEDGTYKPNNNITTAELLSLLMKGAGQTTVVSGDTKAPWEEQVMQKAYDLKIVTDKEMAKTEGAKTVDRGDMSMLLVRVSEVLLKEEKVAVEKPEDYIRDYATISADQQEFVAQAYMKGFVTGDLSANFNAKDNATRAEAAVIVSRVIDKTLRTTPKAIEAAK